MHVPRDREFGDAVAEQGRFRQFHDRMFALGRPTEGEFKPEDSLAPIAEQIAAISSSAWNVVIPYSLRRDR